MYKNLKILAIIPARSGSKRIKDKNIIEVLGRPLFYYSIIQALCSKFIDRTIVSTDSKDYARLAQEFGAEVPFLRPAELSQDESIDFAFVEYTLKNLDEKFDLVVHLRPTCPARETGLIDSFIEEFVDASEYYTSLRTFSLIENKFIKTYLLQENIAVEIADNKKLPANFAEMPCANLPNLYIHNGLLDIYRVENISKGNLSGEKIYPKIIPDYVDVDQLNDLGKLENSPFLEILEEIKNANK